MKKIKEQTGTNEAVFLPLCFPLPPARYDFYSAQAGGNRDRCAAPSQEYCALVTTQYSNNCQLGKKVIFFSPGFSIQEEKKQTLYGFVFHVKESLKRDCNRTCTHRACVRAYVCVCVCVRQRALKQQSSLPSTLAGCRLTAGPRFGGREQKKNCL